MSRTKKIILIVVGVIVLLVGAATVYLLKVNSDENIKYESNFTRSEEHTSELQSQR